MSSTIPKAVARQPFTRTILRSRSSAVKVELCEHHEQRTVKLVDLTAPTLPGLFSPSGLRITAPVHKLPQLIQAFRDAEIEARARGWLPAEPKP